LAARWREGMVPLRGVPADWLHAEALRGLGSLAGLVGASVCGVRVVFAVGWLQGMACCRMEAGVRVQ